MPTHPARSFADAVRAVRWVACCVFVAAAAANGQIVNIQPPSPLPNAIRNKPYSVTLTAITTPRRPLAVDWNITEGCLAGSGLTFAPIDTPSRTATISGTAQQLGTYTCTVTTFVPEDAPFSKTYQISVVNACMGPHISNAALPATTAGTPYLFAVTATGKAPLNYGALGLPAGLTINPATGVIAGTTLLAGTYPVVIIVAGCSGRSSTENVTLVVNPVAATLALTSQPDPALYGQTVDVVAQASGGATPATGTVLLCVVASGQYCAPPIGAPPPGTAAALIPPLLTAPLDAQGEASFALTGLLIQDYVLQAYYGGDAQHAPATSAPVDEFVIKGTVLSQAAQRTGVRGAADPIPTLSTMALGLLALAVLGVAAAQCRRRARGR